MRKLTSWYSSVKFLETWLCTFSKSYLHVTRLQLKPMLHFKMDLKYAVLLFDEFAKKIVVLSHVNHSSVCQVLFLNNSLTVKNVHVPQNEL